MLQQLNSLFVLFHAHSVVTVLWRSHWFLACRYFSGGKKRQIPKVEFAYSLFLDKLVTQNFHHKDLTQLSAFKKSYKGGQMPS